jgi:hypothetical protein
MQILTALALVAIATKIVLETWRDVQAKEKAARDGQDHERR